MLRPIGALIRRRTDQLRHLAPAGWWMLVKLQVLLPAIGAALHLLDYQRTCELLRRGIPEHATGNRGVDQESDIERAQRIARLVGIAANDGLYRATCLRQSLALWWLLRRRGMAAELRIGVRKDGDGFHAHAWVELEDQALNDPSGMSQTFAAFPSIGNTVAVVRQ